MKNMNLKKVAYLIVFSFQILLNSCDGKLESYTVVEKEINESVYASGEIYPQEYLFVKSNKSQYILDLFVKEGDIVSLGDGLVSLGTQEDMEQALLTKKQVDIAKNNISDSSSMLKDLHVKINLAKQKYEVSRNDLERYRELALDSAVSEKKLSDMLLQNKSDYADYLRFMEQYSTQKNQLMNEYYKCKKDLMQRENILRCKMSGKVYCIEKRIGDLVSSDECILLIGTENIYRLELLVDERDIDKIELNQLIYFKTDVNPDKQYTAKIDYINPVLQKSTTSFKIGAKIIEHGSFYINSTVVANIIIRKKVKSLLIPNDYLQDGDSIYVQIGKEKSKRKINIGIKSEEWIEVISGLNEGDVIVKSI